MISFEENEKVKAGTLVIACNDSVYYNEVSHYYHILFADEDYWVPIRRNSKIQKKVFIGLLLEDFVYTKQVYKKKSFIEKFLDNFKDTTFLRYNETKILVGENICAIPVCVLAPYQGNEEFVKKMNKEEWE